jgi:hypothetical protein
MLRRRIVREWWNADRRGIFDKTTWTKPGRALWGLNGFRAERMGVLNRRWRLGEPRRSYRGVDRGGCTRIIGWFCWRNARVKRGLFEALNIRPSTFGGITMCPSSHLCMCCKWRALALPFQDASRLHWQEQAAERKVLTPVAIDPPPETLTGTQRDAIQRKCLMCQAGTSRIVDWVSAADRCPVARSVRSPRRIRRTLLHLLAPLVRQHARCPALRFVRAPGRRRNGGHGPQLGLELKLRHQPCRG